MPQSPKHMPSSVATIDHRMSAVPSRPVPSSCFPFPFSIRPVVRPRFLPEHELIMLAPYLSVITTCTGLGCYGSSPEATMLLAAAILAARCKWPCVFVWSGRGGGEELQHLWHLRAALRTFAFCIRHEISRIYVSITKQLETPTTWKAKALDDLTLIYEWVGGLQGRRVAYKNSKAEARSSRSLGQGD